MSVLETKKILMMEKLRRELGLNVEMALENPDIIEIMVNPDGRLWFDTLSEGMQATEIVLPPTQILMALGTVAAFYDQVITAENPRIQAALPLHGERFQGMRPPICAPSFVIRKHVARVFSLLDLIQQGTVTEEQAGILLDSLRWEKNILIAGATMSGKTVLLDTLLAELPRLHGDNLRVIVVEDTAELHISLQNRVSLQASDTVSLRTLVHTAMRLRPDRLIIGEVRGAEALEMLKSWATGHGGSACTIHAGSEERALRRLKAAIQESGTPADPEFIGEVVDRIVMMQRQAPGQWIVNAIVACEGWHDGHYRLQRLDTPRQEPGYQ